MERLRQGSQQYRIEQASVTTSVTLISSQWQHERRSLGEVGCKLAFRGSRENRQYKAASIVRCVWALPLGCIEGNQLMWLSWDGFNLTYKKLYIIIVSFLYLLYLLQLLKLSFDERVISCFFCCCFLPTALFSFRQGTIMHHLHSCLIQGSAHHTKASRYGDWNSWYPCWNLEKDTLRILRMNKVTKEQNLSKTTEVYGKKQIKAMSPLSHHGQCEITDKYNGWANGASQESEGFPGV